MRTTVGGRKGEKRKLREADLFRTKGVKSLPESARRKGKGYEPLSLPRNQPKGMEVCGGANR